MNPVIGAPYLDSSRIGEAAKVVGKFLAAGGGGAAVAWFIFTRFGDRWLGHKFATRLEQFKHEKSQETEQLRHQIASLFSRISKIHDKEFEVLPIAFLKVHQAYGACYALGSTYQEYPALNQMSSEHFAAFVESCRLPDFRKKELLAATDRDEYYRSWIFWTDLAAARSLHTEFHNYLVMNRIFMSKDLQQHFNGVDQLISSVLTALEIDRQTPGSGLLQRIRDDLVKIPPLLTLVETSIQDRLHYPEA